MKTLAQRTEQLMIELSVDQVGLAKIAGVTKGAVNQWKGSKPTATMAPTPAYAIADKTNYSPRWLMLGEGDERIGQEDGAPKEKIIHLGRRSTDECSSISEVINLMHGMDDAGRWILVGAARQIATQHPLNKQASLSQ